MAPPALAPHSSIPAPRSPRPAARSPLRSYGTAVLNVAVV